MSSLVKLTQEKVQTAKSTKLSGFKNNIFRFVNLIKKKDKF